MSWLNIKLNSIRRTLRAKLKTAKHPVVWWSGGLDSTLLLFLVREIRDTPVIQLRADLSDKQLDFSNQLIKDWQLYTIYYHPQNRYFLNSESLALVDEYSIGAAKIPVLRDLVHDDKRCALRLNPRRTPFFNYKFDLSLMGWRCTDSTPLLPNVRLPKKIKIGESTFFAPIYNLSDKEVRELTEYLKIPVSPFYDSKDETLNTGNVTACSRCIKLPETEKVFCPRIGEEVTGLNWARSA